MLSLPAKLSWLMPVVVEGYLNSFMTHFDMIEILRFIKFKFNHEFENYCF